MYTFSSVHDRGVRTRRFEDSKHKRGFSQMSTVVLSRLPLYSFFRKCFFGFVLRLSITLLIASLYYDFDEAAMKEAIVCIEKWYALSIQVPCRPLPEVGVQYTVRFFGSDFTVSVPVTPQLRSFLESAKSRKSSHLPDTPSVPVPSNEAESLETPTDPSVTALPSLGRWVEIGFDDAFSGYGKEESSGTDKEESSELDEWSDGESDPPSLSLHAHTPEGAVTPTTPSLQSTPTTHSMHITPTTHSMQSTPTTHSMQSTPTTHSMHITPSLHDIHSPLTPSRRTSHSPPTLHLNTTTAEEASLLRSYQLSASPTLLASPTTRCCIPRRAAAPRTDLTENAQRQQMHDRAEQLCAVLALHPNCAVDGVFTVTPIRPSHA